jgi:hypothetical protein
MIDRLPVNVSKGYVEFYAAYDDTLGLNISVLEMNDTGIWAHGGFRGKQRLRVACEPRDNKFSVTVGGPILPKSETPFKDNALREFMMISV